MSLSAFSSTDEAESDIHLSCNRTSVEAHRDFIVGVLSIQKVTIFFSMK